MKKACLYLILIPIVFLAVKCPKTDNKPPQAPPEVLPPATQTGANTFGCLVNGKVWLPHRTDGHFSLDVQYYQGKFLLSAQKDSGTETPQGIYQIMQNMSWSYKPIYTPGIYYFKSIQGYNLAATFNDGTNCSFWSKDDDSLGTYLTITKLDTAKRIISGTFNLIYIPSINETNGNCDTVKITNGRFDAIYTY